MSDQTSTYAICLQQVGDDDKDDQVLECIATEFQANSDILAITSNVFFLIYSASLVFLMQAGFAMICSGSVRKKNVQNTMLKNLLDVCGAALAFFMFGYAFASGDEGDGRTFIGSRNFFLMDMVDDETGGEYSLWLFNFAFAATSATIVAGTLAERCQMRSYLFYSMTMTGFVYPVVAHNIWSHNGFLSYSAGDPLLGSGMIDFAGSGVVHVTGGVTALIASYLLGERQGRFHDDIGEKLEEPKTFPGHSKSLQMLGTLLLWFGWYGFNAGSAINLENELKPVVVALSTVNTTLSAAAAGITALTLQLIITERLTGEAIFDLSRAMNGCLTGLAAVTASCAIIEPWAAVVIGFVSGIVYIGSSNLMIKLCIDDAVDAIPVHLFGGLWGVISVGLFASPRGLKAFMDVSEVDHAGLFYEWGQGSSNVTLLACQIIGSVFILAWVSAIMFPFFVTLNYMGWFRADSLEEIVGLDVSYHGWNPNVADVPQDALDAYDIKKSERLSKHGFMDNDRGVDKVH